MCDLFGLAETEPLTVDRAVSGLDASASALPPPPRSALGAIDTCEADVPGRPSAVGTISVELAALFGVGAGSDLLPVIGFPVVKTGRAPAQATLILAEYDRPSSSSEEALQCCTDGMVLVGSYAYTYEFMLAGRAEGPCRADVAVGSYEAG